jgi:hypothetical protein
VILPDGRTAPATGFQPVGQDAALTQARDTNVRATAARPLVVGDPTRGQDIGRCRKVGNDLQRRYRRPPLGWSDTEGSNRLAGNRAGHSAGSIATGYP